MNKDIREIGGQILVVSQFTLYGNCLSGKRPDFVEAALPEMAFLLYEEFLSELTAKLEKPYKPVFLGLQWKFL